MHVHVHDVATPGSLLLAYYSLQYGSLCIASGIRACRCVQARKWQHCSWHVFACHALMEWSHRSQNQAEHNKCVHIVKGIFELGLKSPHVQCVPEYVREYANWLVRAFLQLSCCACILQ